ncbi:unnamed protein product, partial [marine sediment metagenome]
IDLMLPAAALRTAITGADVREVRVRPGQAAVHLRGRIAGKTALRVRFELPAASGGAASLAKLGLQRGRWSDGTVVVTNTAGGSEVLPERLEGLSELAITDIPREAAAILAGKPVLAYGITGSSWSASMDVINLGEFALRETIADLAHYELVYRGDGAVVCKASYEIRNRSRQFLRLHLPRGAKVLLARVNEQPRPFSPVERHTVQPADKGAEDGYLLPLIRSKASVMGLVSFPVEVVFMYRTDSLGFGDGRAELLLPR